MFLAISSISSDISIPVTPKPSRFRNRDDRPVPQPKSIARFPVTCRAIISGKSRYARKYVLGNSSFEYDSALVWSLHEFSKFNSGFVTGGVLGLVYFILCGFAWIKNWSYFALQTIHQSALLINH